MKSCFGDRLKELRQERGLTQQQLAANLKYQIAQNSIAQWELKQRTPRAEAIILLAEYFGVTTDYILGVGE